MPPTDVFTYTLTSNQTWEQALAYLKSQINPSKLRTGRSFIDGEGTGFILQIPSAYIFSTVVYSSNQCFIEIVDLGSKKMYYWTIYPPNNITYTDQTSNVLPAGFTFKIYY